MALNVFISASVISLCIWLAGQYPRLAGFILALPLSTLLALALTQIQYQDQLKTLHLAKSIFVALLVTLVFFIPFLIAEKVKLGFWQAYVLAIMFIGAVYPLHRWLFRILFER
jgi:hypothetical protein